MAEDTTYKGKLRQKTGASSSVILHPETEAGIVTYDNSTSGLTATNVKAAIDEIVQSGVGVTGVKGDAETTYRTGQVNLTAANIGAIPTTEKGANSGVATLDTGGKVPLSQIPDVILGQLLYGGIVTTGAVATLTANAKTRLDVTTDTITLTNDTTAKTGYKANEGIYYIANASFTFAGLDLVTGDWLISIGTAWKKIDNTDAVSSVNSKTGVVVLSAGDIPYASTTDTQTTKAKIAEVEGKIAVTNSEIDTTGLTGNAVTGMSITNGQIKITGTTNYLVAADIEGKADKASMTAGTYSAVTVNTQGIVTAGAQMIAVVNNGETPATVATNGWFFEKDA